MPVTEQDAGEILGATVKERRARPKERPYIYCDTREQRVLRFAPELEEDCGTAKLDAGDYSVRFYSHVFIAERKNLGDLVSTLSHGRERFENECDLLEQYKWKVLLIEARQDDVEIGAYRSQMSPKAVMGSLDAIYMRWGLVALWCGTPAGAAARLAWFAHRLHKRHPELRQEPLPTEQAP